MTGKQKHRIKQTIWGNWYGYEGRKKVIAFAENAEYTQEQKAVKWLEEKNQRVSK